MTQAEYLTSADTARLLNRTPAAIRARARKGQLPFISTESGQRLFRRTDIERVRQEPAHGK